jgi:hypothetical protein
MLARGLTELQNGGRCFAAALVLASIACGGGEQAAGPGRIDITDAGFMTPESVLMDTVADVYLVSNINGSPLEKDDNGFISRVNPDGTIAELKWIDGANSNVTLNAPKGMAIRGDTLFVADINCVRLFNRVTGESADGECIEGATFLNDLAVGPEGSIFVTDTGMREGAGGALEPSGTDGVYRYAFQAGRAGATLAKSPDLGGPNGVAVSSRGIFVVTFRSGEILRFTAEGEKTQVVQRQGWQLDGIAFTNDGGFMFSNWADSAVYKVNAGGKLAKIVTGVESPAGIGYDPKRNRVMIPLFNKNEVVIQDLGQN